MKAKLLFLILISANCCFSQMPETDIWLFELKNEKGSVFVDRADNITKRQGYDNQPSFSKDEKKIYYVRVGEDKQADVYVYSFSDKKSLPFINSSESEYSPTISSDGKWIRCVVVEKDSSQRIWNYDVRTGKKTDLLFDEDSIGYFHFMNEDTVLYYKLTNPHALFVHSISGNKHQKMGSNIVRSFKNPTRHSFLFGIKDSSRISIYEYDFVLRRGKKYCEYPSLAEDFIWTSDMGLIRSEGAELLKYDQNKSKWIRFFDLSPYGIKKITRFIFDSKRKKLLVVDNT